MASLNKVALIGNLTADPELKTTPSGISVTTFTIAVQRRYSSSQTEGQPTADFISIVAWRKSAEFVCKYFTKGKPILVCGSIQTRNWTDQNGAKRYATEVVADEVGFVESKSQSDAAAAAPGRGSSLGTPSFDNTGASKFEEVSDEDNLPF
ncbi:MAG: single-stranded DNA-binding protein [Clostridia bacterium]|nr:single-stranded DNA-binding protein [Clostridia bacterium]